MRERHGLTNHPLYRKWQSIKSRTGNPNQAAYKYYAPLGRGICEEWSKSFVSFYEWSMANGYREGLVIDRIDNTKGYSPDNCRYVTQKENVRNGNVCVHTTAIAREVRHMHENGMRQSEIARELSLHPVTVSEIVLGKIWADDSQH